MIIPPEQMRQRLILAADDFGANYLANQNILKLIGAKKIDRVAVLINGSLTEDEIKSLKQSGVKIDLHLSAAKKITETKAVAPRLAVFLSRLLASKAISETTEHAWQEQIIKFKILFGRYPDGLNSHQHIHFFPPYFKIALRLCEKFQIPYLRFGAKGILKLKSIVSKILILLWLKDRNSFNKPSIGSSDFLVSWDWVKNKEGFLQILPAGRCELIFHPERNDEAEFLQKNF
jgi:predicted glycoside hydrolase/deacetylase ChbG (UPF0249 family)